MATEVASAYVELGARISKLETGLAAASAQVDAFAKRSDAKAAAASASFSRIGTGVKVAAVAVAAGFGMAVKSALDFDAQMSNVKAVTGATSKQMDTLRSAALATAKSAQGFGYTARDVAQAQVELGKAGMSVSQIMGGAMNASLVLARAGGLQLGDAAAYVSNAMQQFGMRAQQAGTVSDALASAANATTADVGDFGMALVQSGAAARSAGLNFNGTMTALTALAKSGVRGSDAGTSLKTSLLQLINPTNRQSEAAKRAGISFIDQHGKMRSLADISGQLVARTANMTQAQRTALFATLAGTDGVRTLLALYNAGPATIAKYSDQLAKQGSAAQMASDMNDNAAGRVRAAWASLQASAIQLGSAFLPVVAGIATAFTGLLAVVDRLPGGMNMLVGAATALAAAFAVQKVLAFTSALKELAVVSAASGAVKNIGNAMNAYSSTVALGASRTSALGNAMTTLGAGLPFGPLGLLAGAAAAGAAGLLIFGQRTNSAAEMQAHLASISNTAAGAIRGVTDAIRGEIDAMNSLPGAINSASQARVAATAAEKALQKAMADGPRAGESTAAFIARINGLRVAQSKTAEAAAAAEQNVSDKITTASAGLPAFVAANQTRIKSLQDEKTGLMQTAGSLTATTAVRQKAASDIVAIEGRIGVAQAQNNTLLRSRIGQTQAWIQTVKTSNVSEAEKAAAIDSGNRAISRMRGEINKTAGRKISPEIKMATDDPVRRLRELEKAFGLVPSSKSSKVDVQDGAAKKKLQNIKDTTLGTKQVGVNVSVSGNRAVISKIFGFARGGYVPHFAGGGHVQGPGGTDNVPAMLTAGEVVLNKRQQALVDGGMRIREAIARTGGALNGASAFAAGGVVTPLATKIANAKTAVSKAKAAVARAKKAKDDKALKSAQDAQTKAENRLRTLQEQKSTRMDAMSQPLQSVADAIKEGVMARFDAETQTRMKSITDTFNTTGATVKTAFGEFTGTIAQADKLTQTNLKSIERNFKGTMTNSAGAVIATGVSFRQFDIEMRNAQKSLTAMYDAMTPAEAQIKALQDQASSTDLAGNIASAQEKLNQAVAMGDTPEAIRAAQKELDDAQRAQTIAGLQVTAEAERAQREAQRQTAQDQFDAEWETRRQNLQDQLDAQLAQEQEAGAARTAALQAVLDGQLAAEDAARAEARVAREIELEDQGAALLASRTQYLDNWQEIVDSAKAVAKRMRRSGANITKALADGLEESKGDLKGAARGLATLLEDFLKTNSPSKAGPLSTLDKWWDGFAPALMQGLDTTAMEAAVAGAVSAPGAVGGAGGSGGIAVINVTVTDGTLAGMSREQADRVAEQLRPALNRQIAAAF